MKYQLENFSGSYDFRSNVHRDWVVEAHIHEYCELLYCQRGVANVTVNGKQILLPEKHLLWIPPNCIHQYRCMNADVICAVFSHDFIPLDVADMDGVLKSFPTIGKENRLLISGYLNLICARMLEKTELEAMDQLDGILYQRVVSYLSEHFREDISLSSVAATFGYNAKYLSHSLHSLTGVHFSKLLALYRIEYAKKLLSDHRANVGRIAMECGFAAVNTFNRNFKELVGMTPSEYKKTASQN